MGIVTHRKDAVFESETKDEIEDCKRHGPQKEKKKKKGKNAQSCSSDNAPSELRKSFRVCVHFDFRWLKHSSWRNAAAVLSVGRRFHPRTKKESSWTPVFKTSTGRSHYEQQRCWNCSFQALRARAKPLNLPRSSPGRGPPSSLRHRYSTSSSPCLNLHFVQTQTLEEHPSFAAEDPLPLRHSQQ